MIDFFLHRARPHVHIWLLMLIFCVSFFVYLALFESFGAYRSSSDYARDYLIAHHIVSLGEFPLTGPEGLFGPTSNSPVYFYILALFLLIHDSIIFLGLANVFLQACSVLILVLLARELFGWRTAYVSALLFVLCEFTLEQAQELWQPYFMSPFLMLSWLLLVYGYKKKMDILLASSCVAFSLALVIHSSALAVLPVFVALLALVLFLQKAPLSRYLTIFGTFAATTVVMFSPLMYFIAHHTNAAYVARYVTPHISIALPYEVFFRTLTELRLFFGSFFHLNAFFGWAAFACAAFASAATMVYGVEARSRYLSILACIIVFNALCVSLVHSGDGFSIRYFTPAYGALIILISELVVGSFRTVWQLIPVKIAAVFLILFLGVYPFFAQVDLDPVRVATFQVRPTDSDLNLAKDMPHIFPAIDEIIAETGDPRSFVYYGYVHRYRASDATFWTALEEHYRTPFVRVDDTAPRGYAPLALRPLYIIVRCLYSLPGTCGEMFFPSRAGYRIDRLLYQSETASYILLERI